MSHPMNPDTNSDRNPDFSYSLPGDADVYQVAQAFSAAQEARPGDHTLLREWTARYPQYADDLVAVGYARFALGLTLDDAVEDEVVDEDAVPAAGQDETAPLTSLLDDAKAMGLGAADLTAALGLSKPLLAKINQRLLDGATLPRSLVRQIARILGRRAEEVAAYLRGGPRLAMAAHYRADAAPRRAASSAPSSFADALEADREVSDADRAHWRAETAKGTLGDE